MRFAAIVLFFCALIGAQTPSVEELLEQASKAERRGDLASAATAYGHALSIAPSLVPARLNLAGVQMQLGRFDEACENYRAALKQAPSDVRITKLLSNCLVVSGRYAEAVSILTAAEALNPEDLDTAFLLAEALIRQGRLTEGLQLAAKVAHGRNDAAAWMLVGLTQLQMGEGKQAEHSLDQALRVAPGTPGAYTFSGIAKSLNGDSAGAKAAFLKALASDANDFEANVRLGTILRQEGALQEAEQYLDRALSLQTSSLTARYQLAELAVAEGQRERAATELESIERVAPNILEIHEQLAALDYRLHRPEAGKREKELVDHLLAAPQEQDHQLEGAVLVSSSNPTNAQNLK
jgi:tetratricopeptide (TPR) repeat protein